MIVECKCFKMVILCAATNCCSFMFCLQIVLLRLFRSKSLFMQGVGTHSEVNSGESALERMYVLTFIEL